MRELRPAREHRGLQSPLAAHGAADTEKADTADVFRGNISSRQIACPRCGKPVAQGKFCGNCGAPVGMAVCPNCGAENQQGTKFCSECGTRLGGKPKCPSCGTENEAGAKFCCECGEKL